MTSSTHDVVVKGDIFRRTIYPPSLVFISFIFLEVGRGERNSASLKTQKAPIRLGFCWENYIIIATSRTRGLHTVIVFIYRTKTELGDFLWTQWVAVTTHWGATSVPPQYGNPELVLNIACQGQSPSLASTPPTIRVDGRTPQPPRVNNSEKTTRELRE